MSDSAFERFLDRDALSIVASFLFLLDRQSLMIVSRKANGSQPMRRKFQSDMQTLIARGSEIPQWSRSFTIGESPYLEPVYGGKYGSYAPLKPPPLKPRTIAIVDWYKDSIRTIDVYELSHEFDHHEPD